MMGKDLSVFGVHNQLQLLPELDQNLRPSYLVLGYMLVLAVRLFMLTAVIMT